MPDHIREHPRRYGLTIRQCSGSYPDLDSVADAAKMLDRAPYMTDSHGYECDILAAAMHPADNRFAYIQQRSKNGRVVDITIKIHLVDTEFQDRSVEIESYNPFFGCNVRFFQWHGDTAILIYREKHRAYAVRFGSLWPPEFRGITDRWIIHESTLAYHESDGVISCLSIPDFEVLGSLTEAEAKSRHLYPLEVNEFLDWLEQAGQKVDK